MEEYKEAFIQAEFSDNLKFECLYLMPEAVASQELRGKVLRNKDTYEKRLNELKGMALFHLSIVERNENPYKNKEHEKQAEDDVEEYFRYQCQENLKLSFDNKELKPIVYQWEPASELSPVTKLIIGFNVGHEPNNLILTYENKFIDTTELSFQYDQLQKIKINTTDIL